MSKVPMDVLVSNVQRYSNEGHASVVGAQSTAMKKQTIPSCYIRKSKSMKAKLAAIETNQIRIGGTHGVKQRDQEFVLVLLPVKWGNREGQLNLVFPQKVSEVFEPARSCKSTIHIKGQSKSMTQAANFQSQLLI
eukprot:15342666-Ditylum_brightwellii.AAC.2